MTEEYQQQMMRRTPGEQEQRSCCVFLSLLAREVFLSSSPVRAGNHLQTRRLTQEEEK
jgi:hypothetical protein